jgi:hypothetical protein
MATCPHCLGPLTDDHRCPRKRHVRIAQQLAWIVGGAVVGFITMALLDPDQRSTHLDIWVIGGGALAGALIHQAIAGPARN